MKIHAPLTIGQRFERLTVIEPPVRLDGHLKVKVRCDCGTEKIVYVGSLRNALTRSCGCLLIDNIRARLKFIPDDQKRMRHVWRGMFARCYNTRCTSFPRYGGKGILICDEWCDFQKFREWAIQNGYSDDLSIDRIDNAKGYSPSNCRWTTMLEQARNQTKRRRITAFGETKLMKDWSRDSRCTVKFRTLKDRLDNGLPPEVAITLPKNAVTDYSHIKNLD